MIAQCLRQAPERPEGGRGGPGRRWRGGPATPGAPMFNLTTAVLWLVVANLVVHLVRALLPVAVDAEFVWDFGLVSARLTGALPWGPVDPLPVLTYMFLHGGLEHLGINMLALLAFGVGVERRIGTARFLLFYLLCGLAGAAAQLIAFPAMQGPLIGASGAIAGCFAGAIRLVAGARAADGGLSGGLGSLRQVAVVAAVWLGSQVAFGLIGGGLTFDAPVAWWAHIGGFVAGLVLIGPISHGRT